MTQDRLDMKVQIAEMYYRQNMSQQEIAKAVNMSRTTISRILKLCIDEGIVTIHIKNTSSYQYELERKLQEKYGLKYACVVNGQNDFEVSTKMMGEALADYLKKIVDHNFRIGISAGTTVASMIYELQKIDDYNIDVYQMQGDASHQTSNCSSFLAIELARILGGTPHAIHAPLLVHTKILRDLFMEEPFNKNHFQELEKLDVAIVGLGLFDAILPTTSDTWYNFAVEREELKKNVIGDICGRFIDENNQVANVDIQSRTISIDLNNLKNIPYCIAVACGRKKKHIARAAIKGGFVNVLMTDEALARALLED